MGPNWPRLEEESPPSAFSSTLLINMAVPLQARTGPWQPAVELAEPITLVRCCTSPLAKNLVLLGTFVEGSPSHWHVCPSV